ncbi:MAG TPA: hypothetical protein VM308_00515 [Sphingomicrobium sp.]|nr:hypothetical protein [Sphingomicrobium sp.]
MKQVPDRTGRFSTRPHFRPAELDRECESAIVEFLTSVHGNVKFPVSTDDLTKLIERDTDDLDLFADLSNYGATVEGLTEFRPGHRPNVKISSSLADDPRRENRLRTTLTHEWGHVRFHAYLWELEAPTGGLFRRKADANRQICKRDTILDARQTDWMEWQAGYVCGAILMPASRVRNLVTAYFEAEGIYNCAPPGSLHANHLIGAVAHAFAVSEDAARIRLLKLGLLGAAAAPSLFNLPPAA